MEDKVKFVGFLNHNQNDDFYNKSKIYISIPDSDATSISLLEAMYSGCIPVVSDLPANREWIDDGINGIIFSEDIDSLIKRLGKLEINNLIKINENLVKKYGLAKENKKKFFSLYKRILDTHR